MKFTMHRSILGPLLATVCLAWPGRAAPPAAPDLAPAEQAAINSILPSRVLSTVSFLSSDELAGRQTPSAELQIASRYVASRFLGAGLDPLDDEDSFFQIHDFAVSQVSDLPSVLTIADADPVTVLGTLTGGHEELSLTAKVMDEQTALTAEDVTCVVIEELVVPPQAADNPASVLLALFRRIRPLTAKNVSLVLMRCDSQSPLREVARQLQQRPSADRPGLQPGCPIVLIPENADLVGSTITAEIPAQRRFTIPVRNVIAMLPGSDPSLNEAAVLVTAHLDHIGSRFASGEQDLSSTVDRVYNGADDNATGVTAVVTLADALSSLPVAPKRSIVFMTFWGEEKGLLGSKAFVKQPLWPLDHVTANINLEMLGRPEPDAQGKIWMTGWKHSDLGSLMNAGAQRVGVEVFDRPDVGEMLYKRSDNASFLPRGVIAHSFSAGSLHSDYHQVSDEWQKLDIPHMTKVIQGLCAGILHVANNAAVPHKQL